MVVDIEGLHICGVWYTQLDGLCIICMRYNPHRWNGGTCKYTTFHDWAKFCSAVNLFDSKLPTLTG